MYTTSFAGRLGTQAALLPLRSVLKTFSHLVPGIAGELARWVMCRPTGKRRIHPDYARVPAFEPLHLRWGKRQLRGYGWRLDSERPRILLVHGWSGHSLQFASMVEPLLRAGYEVLAFDLPAHGRSSGQLSTLPEIAHAIQYIAQCFGPLHGIVAHSMGSSAATYAIRRGLPAARLVTIAPLLDAKALISSVSKRLWVGRQAHRSMIAAIEKRYAFQMADLQMDSAPLPNTGVLIVHDKHDRAIPHRDSETLQARWPGAQLLTTEGQGHFKVLRAPEVHAAIVKFLGR